MTEFEYMSKVRVYKRRPDSWEVSIGIPARVTDVLPPELWKFPKVTIERENGTVIILANVLRSGNMQPYITIPTTTVKEHNLVAEKVKVTLQW